MERLTNEEVRVDESMDRYLGPLSVLEGMKPKLLDLILNGPVLNGVSKDVLRQIIRQLYSALAAYEDTGLTPEEINDLASVREIPPEAEYAINKHADSIIERLDKLLAQTDDDVRLRELAEADKDGRLVVLPFSDADDVEMQRDGITYKSDHWNILLTAFADDYLTLSGRKLGLFSVKEAEKALEAKKDE